VPVSTSKLAQLGLSFLVLTLITIVGERNRGVAGFLAAMPVQIPLAIWLIFASTGGNIEKTTEFARAAFFGIIPTGIFCLTAWAALNRGLNLPKVYVLAYGIWIVGAFVSYRLLPR
jgi:hypothetical protein